MAIDMTMSMKEQKQVERLLLHFSQGDPKQNKVSHYFQELYLYVPVPVCRLDACCKELLVCGTLDREMKQGDKIVSYCNYLHNNEFEKIQPIERLLLHSTRRFLPIHGNHQNASPTNQKTAGSKFDRTS